MLKISGMLIFISALLASCASFKGPLDYSVTQDLNYSKELHDRHKADLYIPNNTVSPSPVVVLVHGGGWKSRSKKDMNNIAESLASHGFAVLNINYRLAPEFKHPSPIEDLHLALNYLKDHQAKYQLDLKRVGLWGYSSGGHTVSYYASAWQNKSPVKIQAVVAGGAPFNFSWYPKSPYLKAYMGDYQAPLFDAYQEASVPNHLQESMPAFFLYHARKDKLVEAAQSNAFASDLKKNGHDVDIHFIDFWGHSGAFIFSSEAVKKALQFLEEKLKRPSS